MSSLRHDFTLPTTDNYTGDYLIALVFSWFIIIVLLFQVSNLLAEAKYNERRRIYWQSVAEAREHIQREAEEELEHYLQNDRREQEELYRDIADGKRNPKAQTWQCWMGRSRNQARSSVPAFIVPEETAKGSRYMERRAWTRR